MKEEESKIKQIKFSEPKVLKSLLNHKKTTTIRKAWFCDNCMEAGEPESSWKKPCKYEVGKTYEAVWVYKDSEVFCKKCGKGLASLKNPDIPALVKSKNKCGCVADLLYNPLGKVKVKSKEKIEIGKKYLGSSAPGIIQIDRSTYYIKKRIDARDIKEMGWYDNHPETINLAKSEGFKNSKEMFNYLEVYAEGLEVPKSFCLIKFEWVI